MGCTKKHSFHAPLRLFFLFILYLPANIKGQVAQFSFNKITIADNLTSQTNNDYIFKDSYGFIWISSVNGLNRFDGQSIKQYLPNTEDEHALLDGNIQSRFFEDNNKDIWFSTFTAIHKYDRKNDYFHRYFIEEEGVVIQEDYRLLYLDTVHNNLWVQINDKLFHCPIDSLANDNIAVLLSVGVFPFRYNAKIKAGSHSSEHLLFTPAQDSFTITHFMNNVPGFASSKYLPGSFISEFYQENDTVSWVGADNGLIKLKEKEGEEDNIQLFNSFNGQPVIGINGIVPVGAEKLIITTEKSGIFYFDTDKFTHQFFLNDDGKTVPFFFPVIQTYFDNDENLWISSPSHGVFYTNLGKRKFKAVLQRQSDESTVGNNITALAKDSRQRIWCLTNNGISLLDKTGELLPESKRFQGGNVPFSTHIPFYIFCDDADRIWVSTDLGFYVLPSFESRFEKVKFSSKPDAIIFVNQLSDGKILAATRNNGIYEVDEEFLKTDKFIVKPSMELQDSVGYVYIFQDSNKRIYLCRNLKKIIVYDATFSKQIKEIPLDAMIHGIIEDVNNKRIWIATPSGLYDLDLATDTLAIQKDTIFPFQVLNGMLQDSLGNLWISTNRGIIKYNPDAARRRVYSLSDGLQSLEFNFWSALKTKSGKFVFGGVNGLNIFNPYEIKDIGTQARPIITGIKINGELPSYPLKCDSTGVYNISEIRQLVFKSWENSLTIEVAALEYSDPASNQFRYRMKGRNDAWIQNGTDNTINLSFLSPGYYNLEIDATNSDGAWSNNPHRLQIRIKPPWYLSIQAIIFYILATIGLIYAYYRFRISQIRKEEAFKRKEAEFKQKEAEYKQLVAETETAVLRLQMNPHFIFNSMNSINSYILKKDIDTASDYLHRFATLMRMILKFAAKPLIAVSDEIELLELYLQTEAMRFDKKFTYDFELKDDLDPDEFMIPTMILQPFVENAIWHGISGKQNGEGHIKIKFWQENESLFVSVEDNGAGRAASRETSQKAKTHESKALSITEHRLQLLEKKNGVAASFEILDLLDEAQNPAGTKVVLRFPLL